MVRTIRGVDEAKIKDYKEDIDTLLVFVRRFYCTIFCRTKSEYCIGRIILRYHYCVPNRIVQRPSGRPIGRNKSSAIPDGVSTSELIWECAIGHNA